MKNRRNYYRILHIQPDAPAELIKASYRTQMQKLKMHPDLGGDEWNASILNEAYSTLSHPDRRAAYDASLFGDRNSLKQAAQDCNEKSRARQEPPASTSAEDILDLSVCAFCRGARPANACDLEPPVCPGCGGPLQVAKTLRIADTTKRSCDRLPHNAPATVYLDTACPGYRGRLCDLSPVGLRLQVPTPLRAGQIVRIVSDVVDAIARVSFCNRTQHAGQFIAGTAFITVHFHRRSGTFVSDNA